MLILIVEDETAIVRFLERELNAHSHRVLSANNGEQGARMRARSRSIWCCSTSLCPGSTAARS